MMSDEKIPHCEFCYRHDEAGHYSFRKWVNRDFGKYYDEVIEIDLAKLEPYVVGPHTPDLARPISELKKEVKDKGYASNLTAALIGSCTNSSYEDLSRAADVAAQAEKAGLNANDIVVGFNGNGIRSANDLRNKVGLTRVGNTVTLSLLRNGRPQTIEIKVGDAPAAPKL